jgi:hypothetical protein
MARALDLKAAKANPSKFFQSPEEVLGHPGLSRDDKIAILRQWEVDARLLAVAEEENMTEGERSHLGGVSKALIALGDETKQPAAKETGTPSKAGG